jgi:histidine triad (HIT) family protein
MTEAVTLIEDESVAVKMPRQGFVAGHLILTPKSDAMIVEELEQALLMKMFTLANRLAGMLFEALECDGTNLLIQNGVAAGQVDDTVILHLIPRWEEDDLDFSWSKQEMPESELGKVHKQLEFAKEQDSQTGPAALQGEPSGADEGEADTVEAESENDVVEGGDNYYAKQFKRGFE